MRTFATDCEGPISKNDNAYELCARFIPGGDALFRTLSAYDDVLAQVVRPPGYQAGDTLRLIVPFLLAFGVTDEVARAFSARGLLVLPGAKQALALIGGRMPCFVVSTSYRPYLEALAPRLGLRPEQVFCTEISFNRWRLSVGERRRLRQLCREIAALPVPELPPGVERLEDLPPSTRRTVERIDRLLQEISRMECGACLREVRPLGSAEKAACLRRIAERCGGDLSELVYVGDSITDQEALRTVREAGGAAVAFNANRYAIRAAEFACLSPHALALALVAEVFRQGGREALREAAREWSPPRVKAMVDERLWEDAWRASLGQWPQLQLVPPDPRQLIARSEAFRREVRGQEVGALG